MLTHTMKRRIVRLIAATCFVMIRVGSTMAETENEAFKTIAQKVFNMYAFANMTRVSFGLIPHISDTE